MYLIPLARGSKSPAFRGVDWRTLSTDDPDIHREWIRDGLNVGFDVERNQTVVIDADEKQAARDLWKRLREIDPRLVSITTETRRGAHFFFSGKSPTRKWEHGDLKGNGYVVFPASIVDSWQYRFVSQRWEDIQPLPIDLFSQNRKEMKPTTDVIRDIRRYIRKIRSIQGSGGSNACFRVACLLRDQGFSEMDALAEMIEWSRECADPEWSISELIHKIRDAFNVTLNGEGG